LAGLLIVEKRHATAKLRRAIDGDQGLSGQGRLSHLLPPNANKSTMLCVAFARNNNVRTNLQLCGCK
jgi:hypothetical protein